MRATRLHGLRIALLLAWGLLAVPAAAAGHEPRQVELHYEIAIDGIRAASVDVTAAIEGSAINVEAFTRTRGLFDRLARLRSDARTSGQIAGGIFVPAAHEATNEWRGKDRRVRLLYEAGKLASAAVTPSAEEDDRDPVPSDRWIGTVDPISAGVALMLSAAPEAACGRIDVFDGRRLYYFECAPAEDNGNRAGALHAKEYRFEQLLGRQKHPFWPRSKTPKALTIEFWRGESSLPPIVTKVSARAGLVAFSARLTKLTIDGAEITAGAASNPRNAGN